jgi:Acetyltransferases
MSSVQFAAPRVVRPVKREDLERLKKAFPQGPPDKHAARFARQQNGEGVYLVVVQEEQPVAHLLLKWSGAGNGPAAEALPNVPDVEDLFVAPDHRRRRVATRLMDEAERLAVARGYTQVGLSCGAENTAALALYVKRGYRDAGLGTFRLSGTWTDEKGEEQSWEEECVYLVRDLVPAAAPTATGGASGVSEASEQRESGGTAMSDNGTKQEEEGAPAQQPQEQQAAEARDESVVTSDRLVDFAFGVALSAAEVLEKVVKGAVETAKQAQEKAPSFFGEMQEKGRPVREKLVRDLRGDSLKATVQNVADKAADVVTVGKSNFQSAEEEIRALEERVKSLEQEVVARQTVEAPAPEAPVSESPSAAETSGTVESTEAAAPAAPVEAEAPVVETPAALVEAEAPEHYAIAEPEAGPETVAEEELDMETGEVTPVEAAEGEPAEARPKSTRKRGKKADAAAAEAQREGGETGEA